MIIFYIPVRYCRPLESNNKIIWFIALFFYLFGINCIDNNKSLLSPITIMLENSVYYLKLCLNDCIIISINKLKNDIDNLLVYKRTLNSFTNNYK